MLRKYLLTIAYVLTMLSFALGAYLSPLAPERFATHWDAQGVANGYSSPLLGLFLVPTISIILIALYSVFRHVDPLKKNIASSQPYADGIILLIIVFLNYLHAMTLYWNLIGPFAFNRVLAPAFGALFFLIGLMIRNTKRNWFIGIRTPWTLSSDTVWQKTHELGGTLFMVIGAATGILGTLVPQALIWLFLFPIIGASIFLFAYSYMLYRKEAEAKDDD